MIKPQLEAILKQLDADHPLNLTHREIQLLLNQLGHTDAKIRDLLVYRIFTVAFKQNVLSNKQIREILNYIKEHKLLYFEIDKNGDGVFTRSFTSLLLALILYSKRLDREFFESGELRFLMNEMVLYYNKEKDYRGFVDGKGWAHSLAHGADVFDELVQYHDLSLEDLNIIVDCLLQKVVSVNESLIFGEEERIGTVFQSLIHHYPGYENQLITKLTQAFVSQKKLQNKKDFWINLYLRRRLTIYLLSNHTLSPSFHKALKEILKNL